MKRIVKPMLRAILLLVTNPLYTNSWSSQISLMFIQLEIDKDDVSFVVRL